MIVSSPSIPGTGRISDAFQSKCGTFLAIASVFPLLTNPPGRAAYSGQALRYRLSLFRRGETAPFATCDQLRLPINHVSFHPTDPVIAVGIGSYDGGWMFDGDLVLWDWTQHVIWRPFKQIPEVARCSFADDGERLEALVRPWDEEWGAPDGTPWENAYDRLYPISIPYSAIGQAVPLDLVIDPATVLSVPELGKPSGPNSLARKVLDLELEGWFGVPPVHRGAIWDVLWLDRDRMAITHDECLLEVHDLVTGEMRHFAGDGYGAAILRTDPPLIHCAKREIVWHTGKSSSSRLLAFVDDTLTEIACFEGSYSFCGSTDGRVLGRFDRNSSFSAEKPSDADLLISPGAETVVRLDLGHYDVFNHFIGVDGAPYLFLLQGTPPSSHKHKNLCRVQRNGIVERLWPLLCDDGSNASHAMECCGAYVGDDEGEGVILAGCHYNPNPSLPKHGFIYRKPISEDRELWRLQTAAAATTILHIPARGLIAASFLDGTLMLLDAITGGHRAAGRVTVGGLDTVIFSMDAFDDRLVIGTFNGVVAVVTLDELLSQKSDAKGVELA